MRLKLKRTVIGDGPSLYFARTTEREEFLFTLKGRDMTAAVEAAERYADAHLVGSAVRVEWVTDLAKISAET
jgi:hypothetical protein